MTSEKLLFLECALRHPQIVSWVNPTNPSTARRIARAVADREKPQTIVELGAGTGAITRALLAPGVLHTESRLAVIELLPELAEFLRTHTEDPRCCVIEGDAANLETLLAERGIREVDGVVSGIPFSQLEPHLADDIARQLDRVVLPTGAVVAYQVRRNVRDILAPYFPVQTGRWLFRNFPPLRLFTARRA